MLRLSRRTLAVGGVSAALAVGYWTNDSCHDTMRHTYLVARRVSIVGYATSRCFYNYYRALGDEYASEAERQAALSRCHKASADITLWALQQNGGIYIKLGQHISAMTYLLPFEWTDTMVPLQDKCPNSTVDEIDRMFQQDLGHSISDQFSDFCPKPIGVASLAQVHTATLRENGEKVAVKCQHPSLKEFVPLDVMVTQYVFKLTNKFFPEYPLQWLGDELQESIFVELNFQNEAANAEKTANYFKNFQNQTALRIPKVFQASKRILIMEYVSGERLDNLQYMDENHISRSEVSSCLSHIFNNMIFTPGVAIHCDPHGGNISIRKKDPRNKTTTPNNRHNFEIVLYDHGLYRDVPLQMRRQYAHFWLALLSKNTAEMKKYAKLFANITDDQFPLFSAAISGRDLQTAVNFDMTQLRSDTEIQNMKSALMKNEFFTSLMGILSSIPRVVLLILKTNDLTRNLDETLHNPLGPERTFLIMSQYCARTVRDEQLEDIQQNKQHNSWLHRLWLTTLVWLRFSEVYSRVYFYDTVMYFRNLTL